jgi:hypothetical protein
MSGRSSTRISSLLENPHLSRASLDLRLAPTKEFEPLHLVEQPVRAAKFIIDGLSKKQVTIVPGSDAHLGLSALPLI